MTTTETENRKSHPPAPGADLQWLIDSDVDGLLDMAEKPKKVTSSDRLERAFLEVVEFRRTHDRVPSSTTREIAERKLGARLDGILADEAKTTALKHLDEFGLLEIAQTPASIDDLLGSDDLDLLGDDSGLLDVSDLPQRKAPEAPDSIAKRTKAEGFEAFEPLFKAKHEELADGTYRLIPFPGVRSIEGGNFFVLNGVMLFVAEVGETTFTVVGGKQEQKQRLRVIFENGTESSMYRQSLSIRLHEADGQALARAGHDLTEVGDADKESGHIYVLRSRSDNPQIAAMQDLYKIGFSRNSVEKRIANAANAPTYLMAPVDIVADYRTYNLKPSALEHLLHRAFAEVRLDVTQIDTKGRKYDPSEWFVVPLKVINQAINMIMSGEIVDYVYSATSQQLVQRD
ncbi:GIY-YIG nuclease family protein [Cryobacterium psychrophilum]|uniref:GIY-YIG nuclease family protein n=1 Tax=Cryobacterium psychrophilum TaxID=41988 RepID=A0A4Y8KS40_9MICO|nr:GIY-YIG nuclease family protein [Cryobacterium psychrophilum]TDW31423.1 T5orf172 domain-containing protein [Cryobacterium psychrophilum]TFD78864.1 GIY-YIG nuclease family protein [Cryobacterium psychrophilum]